MHKKTYVAASLIHGKGLFAKTAIADGEVIGWLNGKPCSTDAAHVLWISERQGIEVLCDLRYINHSNDPNACYYDDPTSAWLLCAISKRTKKLLIIIIATTGDHP
jgi:hypothetical protein